MQTGEHAGTAVRSSPNWIALRLSPSATVHGRNPFRTAWKPWGNQLFIRYLRWGIESFQGFLVRTDFATNHDIPMPRTLRSFALCLWSWRIAQAASDQRKHLVSRANPNVKECIPMVCADSQYFTFPGTRWLRRNISSDKHSGARRELYLVFHIANSNRKGAVRRNLTLVEHVHGSSVCGRLPRDS